MPGKILVFDWQIFGEKLFGEILMLSFPVRQILMLSLPVIQLLFCLI
jgi:hypothetical protein